MDRIVLVDDETSILELQQEALEGMGFVLSSFSDPRAAWEFLQTHNDVTLVVSDWNMPGMSGMDLLFNIRGLAHPPYVILMTAFGTISRAVKAMNQGAFDFLEKPFEIEHYRKVIKDALQSYRNRPLVECVAPTLRKSTKTKLPIGPAPIVVSAAMKAVYDAAYAAAVTDSSVLLLGESGTGKEILADFIHRSSARASGPLIKVNCAALPEHLMESELFGHEKGSFTGADKRNIGRFEQANGGTLFLDEIGDLPLPLQVKLLRALQEHVIDRVGGSAPVHIDFRLICATHQDLKADIRIGKFREDLYYRINVVPIRLPALRERSEEISPLALHFLTTLNTGASMRPMAFSEAALERLSLFDWPGNVRQLRNAVEYALVLCKAKIIDVCDLPEEIRSETETLPTHFTSVAAAASPSVTNISNPLRAATNAGLRGSVKIVESELIVSMLEKNHWRMSKVAKELEISRSTLYQRMKVYGIKRQ